MIFMAYLTCAGKVQIINLSRGYTFLQLYAHIQGTALILLGYFSKSVEQTLGERKDLFDCEQLKSNFWPKKKVY